MTHRESRNEKVTIDCNGFQVVSPSITLTSTSITQRPVTSNVTGQTTESGGRIPLGAANQSAKTLTMTDLAASVTLLVDIAGYRPGDGASLLISQSFRVAYVAGVLTVTGPVSNSFSWSAGGAPPVNLGFAVAGNTINLNFNNANTLTYGYRFIAVSSGTTPVTFS